MSGEQETNGTSGNGPWPPHPVDRDGEDGQAGRWCGRGARWRHRGAGDGVRAEGAESRHRFHAAHGRLPGGQLRRRQDPRRLLQARGPAEREGSPDLAHDRPPAAAALPRGLRLRDAGDRAPALGRPGERLRHAGDHRRVGRALHLRHPVRRAGRRRARRLLGRRSASSIPRPRTSRPRASSTCWSRAPRTRS